MFSNLFKRKAMPVNYIKYEPKVIRKTCEACPAQWEVLLFDDCLMYIRYRGGYLTVNVSRDCTNNIMDAVNGAEVMAKVLSRRQDGYMTDKEMYKLTAPYIDWSKLLQTSANMVMP